MTSLKDRFDPMILFWFISMIVIGFLCYNMGLASNSCLGYNATDKVEMMIMEYPNNLPDIMGYDYLINENTTIMDLKHFYIGHRSIGKGVLNHYLEGICTND